MLRPSMTVGGATVTTSAPTPLEQTRTPRLIFTTSWPNPSPNPNPNPHPDWTPRFISTTSRPIVPRRPTCGPPSGPTQRQCSRASSDDKSLSIAARARTRSGATRQRPHRCKNSGAPSLRRTRPAGRAGYDGRCRARLDRRRCRGPVVDSRSGTGACARSAAPSRSSCTSRAARQATTPHGKNASG